MVYAMGCVDFQRKTNIADDYRRICRLYRRYNSGEI